MNPLVSVIIPTYKHENYIYDCISSIAEQTYKNLEIIVVDDYSTDNTYELAVKILSNIENRFVRIFYTKNIRNYGAPYTLNKGASFCHGKYLAFCNSDDFFHPDRISTMVSSLEKNKLGIAFSDVKVVDQSGEGVLGDKLSAQIFFGPKLALENFPSISWAFLNEQVATSTGNIVVNRDLFSLVGGFRDLKYCHDWDFYLRAMIYSEPIYVDKALYNYRMHSSNSFSELSGVANKESFECLYSYFIKVSNKNPLNNLAPCIHNWPETFQYYIDRCSGGWVYNNIYKSYKEHFRTIDKMYFLSRKDIKEKANKKNTIEFLDKY